MPFLLVLILLLSACGARPATEAPSAPPTVDFDTEVPPPGDPAVPEPPQHPPEDNEEGPAVVLRGDGIGAARFGTPVDEVLAGLTLRWGPPDSDSGWTPAPDSPFGACPGTEVRVVDWRGFRVFFSDGPTPHGPVGRRHFFTWQYLAGDLAAPRPDPGGNRPPLATEAGVSVASSVADLQAAYGERLELFDVEEGLGPAFGVQLPDGGLLYGSVSSAEPSGLVRSMTAGGGCGD